MNSNWHSVSNKFYLAQCLYNRIMLLFFFSAERATILLCLSWMNYSNYSSINRSVTPYRPINMRVRFSKHQGKVLTSLCREARNHLASENFKQNHQTCHRICCKKQKQHKGVNFRLTQ